MHLYGISHDRYTSIGGVHIMVTKPGQALEFAAQKYHGVTLVSQQGAISNRFQKDKQPVSRIIRHRTKSIIC
jgi:hypothetical protein